MLTAPITTTKVANELQTSSHDVGTLCTSSNINMWAKYKPVSYATNTGITEDQRKEVRYGINVPTKLLDGQQYNINYWTYQKPTGGSNSPYRLGDFRNYNHNAKCGMHAEFQDELLTNGSLTNNYTYNGYFYWNQTPATEVATTLGIRDVFNSEWEDQYLTMSLKDNVGHQTTVTSEYPITYYTTRQEDPIPVSVNIADTWLWNAEDGDTATAALFIAPKTLGTGLSLDIPGYPAVKTLTVKTVTWTAGISITTTVNYTDGKNGDLRAIDVTSVSVTVTVTDSWPRTNLSIRVKGRMTGTFEQQEIQQWVTQEIFIGASEWDNTSTITKTGNLTGQNVRFQFPTTNTASFYAYTYVQNYSMNNDDDRWNSEATLFRSDQLEIFLPQQ